MEFSRQGASRTRIALMLLGAVLSVLGAQNVALSHPVPAAVAMATPAH